MDYKKYKLHDFISDPEFKKWVLHPESDTCQFWEQYIKANPHQNDVMMEAREVIAALKFENYKPTQEQYSSALSNILSGKKSNFTSTENINRYQIEKYNSGLWYKVAASLVLLLTAGALWFFNQAPTEQTVAQVTPQTVIKQNPKGQKSTFILPDGTKVNLNAESSLSYPSEFDSLHRQVVLNGEAFFEVAKDAHRPFTVFTDQITTTALGTSFNIKAYKNDPEINVSLWTGKVLVESQSDGNNGYFKYNEALEPGEKLVHNKSLGSNRKLHFDEAEELGWKDGLLVFNDVDLPEFIQTLERWYGVNIEVIGNRNDRWHIEGKFHNESLKEILDGLDFTLNVRYELSKDSVKIFL